MLADLLSVCLSHGSSDSWLHDWYSVVIKGEPDAEAVLCTARRTYALKIVETTNSLLLVPPVQVHMHVLCCIWQVCRLLIGLYLQLSDGAVSVSPEKGKHSIIT